MMSVSERLPPLQRPVRSYVLRQGRMTASQRRALAELWTDYGLEAARGRVDLNAAYPRRGPSILEIGFGNGETLLQLAMNNPQNNYLGIEVHQPGVGHLLMGLKRLNLDNVRVFCADAVEVLKHNIAESALSGVYLLFPDPWPKKRHHKRRIVQPEFVDMLARKLRPGGFLHMATDWEDYAIQMMTTLTASTAFHNANGQEQFAARPDARPVTRFENRGRSLGHPVRDLVFLRN